MTEQWERREILIWGKTRPEISKKYREIVCTGGVFKDTRRMVRIYPIPLRFATDDEVFKKYQWIEADVRKSGDDPRPESYKINTKTIKLGSVIATKHADWSERASWIFNEHNEFRSVEDMVEAESKDKTSLGIIKPANVIQVSYHKYARADKQSFHERYNGAVTQRELPTDELSGREIRPLLPPDYRFKVTFRCDDPRCQQPHQFTILDWEIDSLYATMRTKLANPTKAAAAVVDKLKEITSHRYDTRFFLGNMSAHPQTFSVVGVWYPQRDRANQMFLNLS